MPRYAALIYSDADTEGQGSPEDWQAIMDEYSAFGAEAGAAGVVLGGEALEDTDTATTIHVEGGKGGTITTTDGPFAETKEVLGGFYILQADDLDGAIEWAAKIPGAWHGRIEVRPLLEFEE